MRSTEDYPIRLLSLVPSRCPPDVLSSIVRNRELFAFNSELTYNRYFQMLLIRITFWS